MCIRDSRYYLELTDRGSTKGSMVARLADMLGIARENIYCAGDNQNDISMLQLSAIPFAPANCAQQVKDWGARVPVSYTHLSKEAARLKGYDNPLCGDFDGIIVPSLLAGNLIVKCWQMHAHAKTCGVIVGAKIPVALTSRSDDKDV